MVRIRVYDGKGRAMGNLDVPAYSAHVWLSGKDQTSSELAGIREIVDPEGQNENYDWDLWAKPAEVNEDLGPEEPKSGTGQEGLLGIG